MSIFIDNVGFINTTLIPDVTKRNPRGTIYVKGDVDDPESWRLKVDTLADSLMIEHFEDLNETDIDLDEAHVTSIQGNSIYTTTDPYFATVLTDSRVDDSIPGGISGDMTGRVVEWDGFVWLNSSDQWFEKANFAESILSDRGVFRRMNVIETNPDDPTEHPPQPEEGNNLGSRNTQSNGLGIEVLSFHDKNNRFGSLIHVIHGKADDQIDQVHSVKAGGTLIGFIYEDAWVANTYVVGDIIVNTGIRYKCNTSGAQITSFAVNSSLWDKVDVNIFNVDDILTNQNEDVLVNQFGNVLVSG